MPCNHTLINTDLPVTLSEATQHAGVNSHDEDAAFVTFILAAEVEAQTGLALVPTSMTCTTEAWPVTAISLPVDPAAANAVATVLAISDDGTAATFTGRFWLETGRHPVLQTGNDTKWHAADQLSGRHGQNPGQHPRQSAPCHRGSGSPLLRPAKGRHARGRPAYGLRGPSRRP